MKKLIIGTIVAAGISVNSLYANTGTASVEDAKALYQCMITKAGEEQKKYIKEYGFLSFAYPDKVARKFLNVDENQIRDISVKAGKAFTDLMVNKCGNETKKLFMNNPLPVAYQKFAQVINGVVEYIFTDPKDKDPLAQQKAEQWLKEGMESNKEFKNFIHSIFVEKMQEKK